MKAKHFTFAALSLVSVIATAQDNFFLDMKRIGRATELAKTCEALQRAGGSDPGCPTAAPAQPKSEAISIVPAVKGAAPTGGANAAPRSAQAPVQTGEPEISVLAYASTEDQAFIDVNVNGRKRRLTVGQSVKGWLLTELTDDVATFEYKPEKRPPLHIAFRTPGRVMIDMEQFRPAGPNAAAPGAGPGPAPYGTTNPGVMPR